MKSPIVINESHTIDLPGDMTFFESVADLEGYVEPIDVENEEYFAFDAEGRLLRLETDGKVVRVTEAESQPHHEDVLRHLLVQGFLRDGVSETWCANASLADLVDRGRNSYRVL